ncbi:MAG TPA: FAD-dependent oxidoreductase, partial [Xanthobacteraceae bacterium]|nr:FAD-dependent oxidoreductase [Xanthobacteraceae bacterium]
MDFDVVVVGAGNAALCAALAARENNARVAVLERAPEDQDGGNSRFTAGAFRCVYGGVDDLKKIMPDLSPEEIANTDFGTYTEDQFFDDMFRVTQYRADPDLVEHLVRSSLATMMWMREKGVRFVPIYGRQAFKIGDKFKFWGGLTVESWGGGPGLVDTLKALCRRNGIEIFHDTRALSLIFEDFCVNGVRARRGNQIVDYRAGAVVLACGGFESNAEWRTRYLGPGWELAKVRGTWCNTGDGIRMAL